MDRDGLALMPEAGPLPGSEAKASATAKGGSSFRALRSRNFRLYFIGQVVSASGSFLQQTAIGWLVLERTGSPGDLGLVLAAGGIPSLLLAPGAGWWPTGWTCASSSWSPRRSIASWLRCYGRWPQQARRAWRLWWPSG